MFEMTPHHRRRVAPVRGPARPPILPPSAGPGVRVCVRRARNVFAGILLACLCVPGLATGDPANDEPRVRESKATPSRVDSTSKIASIVMEIESSTFELHVRDAGTGETGPTIRVALGSPAQSTPTGAFPLERIILSPSWKPGVVAKLTGAEPEDASLDTPMGAVKIPFASNGVIALHGGGDRRSLGKRISAGCVRATDADLLRVVAWLDGRDALTTATEVQNGEIHRLFRRPIQLVVR